MEWPLSCSTLCMFALEFYEFAFSSLSTKLMTMMEDETTDNLFMTFGIEIKVQVWNMFYSIFCA